MNDNDTGAVDGAIWERLFDSLNTPLWVMNERREILRANRAAAAFLGLHDTEIKGRRCHELVHGTDRPIAGCPCDTAVKELKRGILEVNARGRDLEAAVDPVTDGKGRLLGLAHVLSDIGVHKARAEDAGKKKQEMEDLLLLAAHDLRTPLLCLHGYAEFLQADVSRLAALLESGRFGEDARCAALEIARSIAGDTLGAVSGSAGQISRLVESLGKVARAGGLKMTPEKVETADLLRGLLGVLDLQAARAFARIELGELPPCTADRAALGQIFSNLLGNALKFRDPARPLVVKVDGEAGKRTVTYRVADNGAGISPEDLADIWKIFFSRPGPAAEKGDGVGLTMARRLAEANGGRLRAESRRGEGSTFFLELPR